MPINPVTPVKLDVAGTVHEPMMIDGSQTVPVGVIPLSADAGQILSVGSDGGVLAALPDPLPGSAVQVSGDDGNQLVIGSDSGLYVGLDKPKVAFRARLRAQGRYYRTILHNVSTR